MERGKRESQEKTSKRRRVKRLKNKPNLKPLQLNKLKTKKLLLPRGKAEEEEEEKVNNDQFKLKNLSLSIKTQTIQAIHILFNNLPS